MVAVQQLSTATPSAVSDRGGLLPVVDLPQRPRTTSAPGVRIEGVRGSNPLSSTQVTAGSDRRTGLLAARCSSKVQQSRSGGELAAPVEHPLAVVLDHLVHEEREVLPLIERHLTRQQRRAFLHKEPARRSPRERPEFVAWILTTSASTTPRPF